MILVAFAVCHAGMAAWFIAHGNGAWNLAVRVKCEVTDDGCDLLLVRAEHQTDDEDDRLEKSHLIEKVGFKVAENIFNKIYHNRMVSHRKVW